MRDCLTPNPALGLPVEALGTLVRPSVFKTDGGLVNAWSRGVRFSCASAMGESAGESNRWCARPFGPARPPPAQRSWAACVGNESPARVARGKSAVESNRWCARPFGPARPPPAQRSWAACVGNESPARVARSESAVESNRWCARPFGPARPPPAQRSWAACACVLRS